MNKKKICKILGTTTIMISAAVLAGMINNSPVYAAENELKLNCESTTSSAVSVNENKEKDYTIYVNASTEKDGFKLTIKNVTATKHNLKVVASIESNKLSNYDSNLSADDILQMTVKNVQCNAKGEEYRKINDNTMEYTFYIDSLEDFPDNIQLRFDALLPEYDLNAWLNTTVNISKYFNKTYSKDINFHMGDNSFYKLESDILGTNIYYKENDTNEYSSDSYENKTWDSKSKLLIKYNDKIYETDDKYSFINHSDNNIYGYYATSLINIDDFNLDNGVSIIPIKCNIKKSEIENIIDSELDIEEDSEDNNVKYNKEFKFAEGSKGIVSKVERDDEKVKIYFSASSEKDSLLMALSMQGYYDYNEDDFNNYYNNEDIEKVIYKNPDNESEYIVEFGNVIKNRKFIIDSNNRVFSHNDKFEVGEEIKIK